MVPKQCLFPRPTFWYLACCATCLDSRDNSKYHTHTHTHTPTYPHTWPKSDFHRLFDSGFAPSALSLRLNKSFSKYVFGYVGTLNFRFSLLTKNSAITLSLNKQFAAHMHNEEMCEERNYRLLITGIRVFKVSGVWILYEEKITFNCFLQSI